MNNHQDLQEEPFSGKSGGFNFKLLFSTVLANWYWFVAAVALGLGIAYSYLKYSTPMYMATARILISADGKESASQAALLEELGGLGKSNSDIQNELIVLRTRLLMEKVVKNLKANITYSHVGNIRTVELHDSPIAIRLLDSAKKRSATTFRLSIDKGDVLLKINEIEKRVSLNRPFKMEGLGNILIESKVSDTEGQEYEVNVTSVEAKAAELLGRLAVGMPNKELDILDLSITHAVPEKAVALLNTLIEEYVKEKLEDKNKVTNSTLDFIENRLVFVSEELGSVEGSIENFRQRNRLANLPEQSSLLINTSNEYAKQLSQVETQLSILNSLEEYVADPDQQRVVPGGLLPDNPVFAGLVERYNTLVLEKERNSLSQTENSPYIRNLTSQISGVRNDMLANLKNTRSSLLITRNNVKAKVSAAEGQIREVPSKERNFLDLSRQQQIKQELYIFLLKKREETAISKSANTSNTKVIDPPVSFGPISPNRTNILLYGFFGGLLIPFGIVFLRIQFNTRVMTKEDVSANTQVPIIAEISNSGERERQIVVSRDSRTPIAEQFRALRTNLSFFLKEHEKTILVTSSMSGEGKSFVSLNLAITLAISGKRVLVMEMDLRKPNFSNKLNLDNSFGFTNYIVSSSLLSKDIIRSSGVEDNLWVISSGPLPPNPAEILLNPKLDKLMDELKELYDYIIIDAPPVGIVTDAQLLSKYSDLTLYLVRQHYTHKNQLHIAEDIYSNKKMKSIALLINDIKAADGYGYGYGYGYAYGYGGEELKKNGNLFRKWFGK